MGDTVRIRVSLAVLAIDDFTGRVIVSPGLRASLKAEGIRVQKPLRKPEGFFVFTGLTDRVVSLVMEGAGYQKEERQVDLTRLKPGEPVIRVRMRPDRTYPDRGNAIALVVALPKDTEFFVFCPGGSRNKRLLGDYKKGDEEMGIYQEEPEELEGKTCCAADKNDRYQVFCLGAPTDREKGIYRLERAPGQGYKKIGTRIYPADFVKSTEEGEYFLLLRRYGPADTEYICVAERGGKRTERKVTFAAGRENRLDVREGWL